MDRLFKMDKPEVAHKLGKLLWTNTDQSGLKLVTKLNESRDHLPLQSRNATQKSESPAKLERNLEFASLLHPQVFDLQEYQRRQDMRIVEIGRQHARVRVWLVFIATVVFLSLFVAVSMLFVLFCPACSYVAVTTLCNAFQTICCSCWYFLKRLCFNQSQSDPYYDGLDFEYETI